MFLFPKVHSSSRAPCLYEASSPCCPSQRLPACGSRATPQNLQRAQPPERTSSPTAYFPSAHSLEGDIRPFLGYPTSEGAAQIEARRTQVPRSCPDLQGCLSGTSLHHTCPGGWTVKIVCFFILACLWDPSASDRKRLGNKDKRMPKHIHCQEIKMTKSPSRCH